MLKKMFRYIVNDSKSLVGTFTLLILISAILYSVSEHTDILDGIWWAIVTATTVGYGDSFPHNLLGKITAVSLMLSMVLLFIPAITARMASGLIVDHDAFTHEEQEQIKDDLKSILTKMKRIEKDELS